MKQFGLIGYPLSHSFSEDYFKDKFRKENISDKVYQLFPIKRIEQFPGLVLETPSLVGLNVTIPYKESVIQYLDELDEVARDIGAVNCIKIDRYSRENKLIGYNTDVIGFEKTLKPYLKSWHQHAIILGTGGSSKAVAYGLKKLGITFTFISRSPREKSTIGYASLTQAIIQNNFLIINTTPLGMFPGIQNFPPIPYEYLTGQHLLFDLIYNPGKTIFLQKGELQGATILNGLQMLHIQAEKSFEIWNR